MSFYNFPGFTPANDNSFHRLFNLLDQFDDYNQGATTQRRSMKAFSPKFDVKETGETYELHGELPGVEQKDIEIEFSDDHTISIKGRTERSYTSGTPPAGFVEGPAASGAITEAGEHHNNGNGHRATVEDEDAAEKSATTTTEVAKKDHHEEHATKKPGQPQHKYWVSERSVGEFSRSFSFPVRVDQDAVHASMKNGILSIVVPKAKKQSSRKISIS